MTVRSDGGHFGNASQFVFASAPGWSRSEGKFQSDRHHRAEEGRGAEEPPVLALGLCTSLTASFSKILVLGWLLNAFWQHQ